MEVKMQEIKKLLILVYGLATLIACAKDNHDLYWEKTERIDHDFWQIDEEVWQRLRHDSCFTRLREVLLESRAKLLNLDSMEINAEFERSRQIIKQIRLLGSRSKINNLLAYCLQEENEVLSRIQHEWGPCTINIGGTSVCNTYKNWQLGWEYYATLEQHCYASMSYQGYSLDLRAFREAMSFSLRHPNYQQAFDYVMKRTFRENLGNDISMASMSYRLEEIIKWFLPNEVCKAMKDLTTTMYDTYLKIDYQNLIIGISPSNPGISGEGILGEKTGPSSDLTKLIFNEDSRLTKEQWKKVDSVLKYINNDCMGGRLVDTLQGMKVSLFHDAQLEANGKMNHDTRVLLIKSFNDYGLLERTLFHELVHAAQSGNGAPALNREVEAHVAVFRYAVKNRNRILLKSKKYNNMHIIHSSMNSKYEIKDKDTFDYGYKVVIDNLKNEGYQDFPESESYRNLNTIRALSKDC